MTKCEELFCHAERCAHLAETCTDKAIAKKLQQLARDYRDFAMRMLIPRVEVGSVALDTEHHQALLSKLIRCNCEFKEFLANCSNQSKGQLSVEGSKL